MKRTRYKVMTSYSMEKVVYRRLFMDDEGKRYIRENGKYKCIEDNPRLLANIVGDAKF